jgi:hypothetical protein
MTWCSRWLSGQLWPMRLSTNGECRFEEGGAAACTAAGAASMYRLRARDSPLLWSWKEDAVAEAVAASYPVQVAAFAG